MRFVNLCQHEINVVDFHGNPIMTLPPSGQVARCSSTAKHAGYLGACPLFETTFGEVEGLPEPAPDTYYVVSGLTLAGVKDRPDVLAPGELLRAPKGGLVRSDGTVIAEGQPVGCVGLRVG